MEDLTFIEIFFTIPFAIITILSLISIVIIFLTLYDELGGKGAAIFFIILFLIIWLISSSIYIANKTEEEKELKQIELIKQNCKD